MRGHETDALDADFVELCKQLRKAQLALHVKTVGIDVLAQQHDLLDAFFLELACLLDDPGGRAGALPAAHIRHDAVRAEVVAAVHDRDVGVIRAAAAHRQILRNAALVLLNHLDHAAAVLDRLQHQLRKAVQVVRTERHVHKRILPENLLAHALLLHHAAADGDHHLGPGLLELLEPGDVSKRAALRIVADAAGVEDHEIRRLAAFSLRHAHLLQHTGQLLAVVRVHLASVCDHAVGVRAVFNRRKFAHQRFLMRDFLRRQLDGFQSFHQSFLIPSGLASRGTGMPSPICSMSNFSACLPGTGSA